MPDIDDVLERLLTEPGFAAALARDPATALAGYQLSEDDLSVLSTQVSLGTGADSRVEERISKASTFGLLSSVVAGLGVGMGDGTELGGPDTAPPAPDSGEQVYLAIQLENVQVHGDVDDLTLGGPDTEPSPPDAGDDWHDDAVDFVAWPRPNTTPLGEITLNFEQIKPDYGSGNSSPGIIDPDQAGIGDPNESGDPGQGANADTSSVATVMDLTFDGELPNDGPPPAAVIDPNQTVDPGATGDPDRRRG